MGEAIHLFQIACGVFELRLPSELLVALPFGAAQPHLGRVGVAPVPHTLIVFAITAVLVFDPSAPRRLAFTGPAQPVNATRSRARVLQVSANALQLEQLRLELLDETVEAVLFASPDKAVESLGFRARRADRERDVPGDIVGRAATRRWSQSCHSPPLGVCRRRPRWQQGTRCALFFIIISLGTIITRQSIRGPFSGERDVEQSVQLINTINVELVNCEVIRTRLVALASSLNENRLKLGAPCAG